VQEKTSLAQSENPAQPKRRGRPPKLTRAQILQAGYDLLRSQGREALTMRAVAEALGTGAMSLYTHVRDKDELLIGISGLALEKLVVDDQVSGSWQEQLAHWAYSLREQLLAHPEALELMSRQHHGSPQLLLAVRGAIRNLQGVGFELPRAAQIADGLLWTTIGFASMEIAASQGPKEESAQEQYEMALASLSDEERPEIESFLPHFTTGDMFPLFKSVVEHMIRGVAAER
jgi:AcrR family transcriptional regulator